jgi:hypothetical protein
LFYNQTWDRLGTTANDVNSILEDKLIFFQLSLFYLKFCDKLNKKSKFHSLSLSVRTITKKPKTSQAITTNTPTSCTTIEFKKGIKKSRLLCYNGHNFSKHRVIKEKTFWMCSKIVSKIILTTITIDS